MIEAFFFVVMMANSYPDGSRALWVFDFADFPTREECVEFGKGNYLELGMMAMSEYVEDFDNPRPLSWNCLTQEEIDAGMKKEGIKV
jgi:hypothetical protein